MAVNAKKMAKFCRPFRILLGIALIAAAYYYKINWLYIGVLPLIAGIVGLCPACVITKQCTIFGKDL